MFANPAKFQRLSRKLLPWLSILCAVLMAIGLYLALFVAPPDYQQGETARIMYVHVPSAFLAMMIYAAMAMFAFMTLVFRIKIAAIAMTVSAQIGIWFTLLALITGAIWGKPMWGTFWIWDARLTSVLILFFLYLGFLVLQSVIPHLATRERASAILALVGVINLPIIHYSVIWWNTLHQGPSISQFAKPAIESSMLYPLLSMIAAFVLCYVGLLLLRMQSEILLREKESFWVREVICG